ncbi:MAG: crossover junction endodeoxyribonuclease RuvC [Phycisphaerales bacterium]
MRVLGIDPGTRVTGYGAVEGVPSPRRRPALLEAGVIRLVRGRDGTPPLSARLSELEHDVSALLDRVRPELVCLESLFSNPKHPGTVITMAHARGVILLAVHRAGCELREVPPAEVKRAVAGSGRAGKPQMQASVQRLLGLPEPPSPADVADALALAIGGLWRQDAARIRSGSA